MQEEAHYKVLKLIEEDPTISQREMARALGMSLGKVNYCLRALIEKGLVKANNFRNKKNKTSYSYLLTPRGIETKAAMTVKFLKRKIAEFEALKTEIEQLKREQQSMNKGRRKR